jgi:hypothetical protein
VLNEHVRKGGEEVKSIRIRLDGKSLLLILAIALILIGGTALRLHSLSYTPYPYILDGLGEAQYAEHIADTGSLTPEQGTAYSKTHTVNTPAYDALIASFSLIQGEQPLFLLQKLIAPFSVLMLIGAYTLARRFSGSYRVSILTMMAMSAYGPFLMITQATWKECIGISLMPLIFLTFMMRKNRSMRAISILLMLFIPFIHHFIALLTILTIAFASTASFLKARKEKKLRTGNVLDALVAIIAIDEMAMYYSLVRLDRLEFMTPQNGLYLFIGLAALIALGVHYIADKGLSEGGRRAMIVATSGGLIALLAVNLIAPLGTIEFSALWALSLPMVACLILVLIGIMGISLWASTTSEHKAIFFAILASPFCFVIYGLMRGGDVISLDMITRTVDLLDLGVMIGLATFLVYFLRNRSKVQTMVTAIAVCALLLVTIPIAIDSENYAATRNDIYSYEINGINWTASLAQKGDIQTDVLFTYTSYLFNKIDDATLVRRIAGDFDFSSGKWMIASEKWITDGVKDLPYGWVRIDSTVFHSKIDGCNSLYIGGPTGSQIVVFMLP